jgi:hypothetical protein
MLFFLFIMLLSWPYFEQALKAQKDAKDESTRIAFRNLRSEKDNILISLVNKLKESRAK